MLDDLGAIQARISEIQGRIAALNAPAAPAVAPEGTPANPTFQAALQKAQMVPLSQASEAAGVFQNAPPGVAVPPATLGPLPPMPVSMDAAHLVPLPQTSTGHYADLIQTYAAKHGIDPNLVRAVIQTESGGNPRAVSRVGAKGLMQLMPTNVQEAGISDPFDPEQNIAAGTQQLSALLKEYGGDLDLTLAGYNAGPGNVHKYGGIPPFRETQDYIRKVRAAMTKDGG